VAILAHLGYRVVASTGRASAHDYLRSLGAAEILDRAALANASPRPLETERWGGAIDSVGGTTLAALLASMAAGASVAACGVAGGSALPTTVFPFILRGVSLLGMDSLRVAQPQRRAIWTRLERDLPLAALDRMIQVAPLGDVPRLAEAILRGEIRGRTVIDVNT
jgi:acrylyl-CoA reductase (NADPH)